MAELLAVLRERLDLRWRGPIELRHAHATARLASAVGGAQVSKMRLGVSDAGIGTGTETAFRNGLDASARPRSESDIPRARAIQASDKRIAKES
jgi:hypothetical protein